MTEPAIYTRIRHELTENPVVLFMKGNQDIPMCGFSATVVHILKKLNVSFKAIDVLRDPEIREGIKEFTQWPTIPQLYIQQEFMGGCDIVKEMFEMGELQKVLAEKNIPFQD